MHRASVVLIPAIILSLVVSKPCSAETKSRNSSALVGIGIGTGGIGIGVAGFFIARAIRRDRQHGRAFVSQTESFYTQANARFEAHDFAGSRVLVDSITPRMDDYARYVRKLRSRQLFSLADLDSLRDKSDLLITLVPTIQRLTNTTSNLPQTSEALISANKWSIMDTVKRVHQEIDALIASSSPFGEDVKRRLKAPLSVIALIETMFRDVYMDEQNTFNLKARFHYNRALASKDSTKIREFVADCDYYRNTKEYCERARDLFRTQTTAITSVIKPTSRDPASQQKSLMEMEHREAMASGRIDLLEAYLAKYSKRKKDAPPARIEQVRTFYEKRKREIAAQRSFENTHPRFVETTHHRPTLSITTSGHLQETLVRSAIDSMWGSMAAISGLRYPASLSIDLKPGAYWYMLNAYLDPRTDVRKDSETDGSSTILHVPGAQSGKNMLHQIHGRIQQMSSASNAEEKVTYVVRLWKNSTEYLTFYGRSGKGGMLESFGSFDITAGNHRDLRSAGYSSPTIVMRDSTAAPFRALQAFLQEQAQ